MQAREAVIVVDKTADILLANEAAARYFGCADASLLRGSLLTRIQHIDHDLVRSLLDRRQILEQSQATESEVCIERDDGGVVLCTIARVPLVIGEEILFLITFTDLLPQRLLTGSRPVTTWARIAEEVMVAVRSEFLGAHIDSVLRRAGVRHVCTAVDLARAELSREPGRFPSMIYAAATIGPDEVAEIGEIRTGNPGLLLLVVTISSDESYDLEVIRAGANGIIDSEENFDLIVRALGAINTGEIWCPRSVMARLLESSPAAGGHSGIKGLGVFGLTAREREVLALLCRNKTNKEMAIDLGIAPTTVVTHLFNLYRKLNVSNRYQATQFALSHHLVDLPITTG
jgi:PAS domain S-box-containing protein